ncbi:serine protease [Allopontixanthobacter sp.]|uniref:S1 family peptidase n=1 Tax=Allopontixanthobacter sp. TaxID=2906452 RepID=UPI002AB9C1EA|nr:serine protease [Allopontixanthobacter sp.]MDZ4307181.1 serine protease [Allopontixanthobacter sp.]
MSYSPVVGGHHGVGFPLQFPSAKITDVSLSTTLVEQLSPADDNVVISHGTGFFWRHGTDVFLITARHVVTGRDPFTNEPMSNKGFLPERFRFYPTIEVSPDRWGRATVRLDFATDEPTNWLEDPEFERLRTDIAALKVTSLSGVLGRKIKCLNDEPSNFSDIMSSVGFECSIIGFPQANVGGLMTPIWRRGTLASEPLLPVDSKPMFLLDASTSPGFSGGPVFRRHIGPAPTIDADGSVEVKLDAVVTMSFVGVYAGRLSHSHFGGEVPFVFYGNRIPIILGAAATLPS